MVRSPISWSAPVRLIENAAIHADGIVRVKSRVAIHTSEIANNCQQLYLSFRQLERFLKQVNLVEPKEKAVVCVFSAFFAPRFDEKSDVNVGPGQTTHLWSEYE